MSQRNHDPTETNLPVFSTTITLRDALENLKTEEEFHITVEIVWENRKESASEKLNTLAKETAAKLSPEDMKAKPKDLGSEH